MRTFRRRSRLAAFGLVDTMVGIFLLTVAVALLFNGFSTLMQLGLRQEIKAEAMVKAIDTHAYAAWF